MLVTGIFNQAAHLGYRVGMKAVYELFRHIFGTYDVTGYLRDREGVWQLDYLRSRLICVANQSSRKRIARIIHFRDISARLGCLIIAGR